MCGFVGCVSQDKDLIKNIDIKSMIKLISHRGPDNQKTFKNNFCALGHARLRIIDLDKRSDQPFFSCDKSKIIVFNGEIYNFLELKSKLKNYDFKTKCDTEVLIAAYEKWGIDFIKRIDGMFSFVLVDLEKKITLGVRDSFGIKPFYYSLNDGTLAFSSEIKALKPYLKKFEPNYNTIVDYLTSINFENNKTTFFKNINQLLPGEYFIFENEILTVKKFKSFVKSKINKNENINTISKELFFKSVKNQMISDVPVGLLYSGGIDSALIASAINEIFPNSKTKSLTAVSENVLENEILFIKNSSKELNLNNKIINISLDGYSNYCKKLMYHMESPFQPNAIIVDNLFKTLKEMDVIVCLDGNGADEILSGYERYYYYYIIDCLKKFKISTIYKSLKNVNKNLSKNIFFKIIKYWSLIKFQRSIFYKIYKRNFKPKIYNYLNDDLKKIYNQKKITPFLNNISSSYLYNAMLTDIFSKLQLVLRTRDRISMKYSRELRVPYLGLEFSYYLLNVSDKYKIGTEKLKTFLINSTKLQIPKKIVSTAKNELLKNKTKSNAKLLIIDEMKKVMSSQKALQRHLFSSYIFNDIDNFQKENSIIFWKIAQIELLHQVYFDK